MLARVSNSATGKLTESIPITWHIISLNNHSLATILAKVVGIRRNDEEKLDMMKLKANLFDGLTRSSRFLMNNAKHIKLIIVLTMVWQQRNTADVVSSD